MARPFVKQDPTLPQGFSITFRQRFWSKIDKHGLIPIHCSHLGPCWIWQGHLDKRGYGRISMGGRTATTILAHVASWIIHYGTPPCENPWILHKCDNPTCVHPLHLFPGTHRINMQDMRNKGRSLSGERHKDAILTKEQVQKIRSEYVPRIMSQYKLGQKYGVSRGAIEAIVHGTSWK